MRKPRRPEPGELVRALARDAVSLQRDADAAWERDLERMAPALPGLRSVLGDQARALLPSRRVFKRFEATSRVRVELSKSVGGAIRLLPLNLAYDLRYRRVSANEHTVSIVVEQTPDLHTKRQPDQE